jgi:hypothetical protein
MCGGAVVAIVGGDGLHHLGVDGLGILEFETGFEGCSGAACVGERDLSLVAEELFEFLDGVAFDAGADGVSGDVVEIDED